MLTVGAKVRKAPKKRKLYELGSEYLSKFEIDNRQPAKRMKPNQPDFDMTGQEEGESSAFQDPNGQAQK
jgi:hypothetical protein